MTPWFSPQEEKIAAIVIHIDRVEKQLMARKGLKRRLVIGEKLKRLYAIYRKLKAEES